MENQNIQTIQNEGFENPIEAIKNQTKQRSNNYLDSLREQAQLQLEAQKKANDQEEDIDDPYAEFRDEIEEESSNNQFLQPQYMDDNPDLVVQHEPPDNDLSDDYYNPINYQEDAIYEGGPGQSQIDIWKKTFPHSQIMHTKIGLRDFVIRTLNRFEYKQIIVMPNIDALTREEVICKTCVLWPMNYSFKVMANEDSGYPGTLAQIIMESSGFTSEYGIEVL